MARFGDDETLKADGVSVVLTIPRNKFGRILSVASRR